MNLTYVAMCITCGDRIAFAAPTAAMSWTTAHTGDLGPHQTLVIVSQL